MKGKSIEALKRAMLRSGNDSEAIVEAIKEFFPEKTDSVSKKDVTWTRSRMKNKGQLPAKISEVHLIQETIGPDLYAQLVAATFLNSTTGISVRPVLGRFLYKYPTPKSLAAEKEENIRPFFENLGLPARAKTLIEIARGIVNQIPPEDIPGVGRYALDSIAIFVNGERDLAPSDEKLAAYLKTQEDQG